jgi:hypothetical protein
MPWKQDKDRTVCDGCAEHCKLSIELVERRGPYMSTDVVGYVPQIGEVVIREYRDESGRLVNAQCRCSEECAKQLHYLCTLCDNYKKTH